MKVRERGRKRVRVGERVCANAFPPCRPRPTLSLLSLLRSLLCPSSGPSSVPPPVLFRSVLPQTLLLTCSSNRFPQSRKDTALIFGNLLRRQIGTRSPTVDYLCSHDQILSDLIRGYENPDVALNAGIMLRECSKHESLTKIILNSEDFYRFFDYVELSTFDVASDAFTTFRVRARPRRTGRKERRQGQGKGGKEPRQGKGG